jgi:hypothetical protein
MVRAKDIVTTLLVVILAIVAGSFVQSDTKRLKQFDSPSKQVSKEKGKSIAMATKGEAIATLFAETCELTIPSWPHGDRTPARYRVMRPTAASPFVELFSIYDIHVDL